MDNWKLEIFKVPFKKEHQNESFRYISNTVCADYYAKNYKALLNQR